MNIDKTLPEMTASSVEVLYLHHDNDLHVGYLEGGDDSGFVLVKFSGVDEVRLHTEFNDEGLRSHPLHPKIKPYEFQYVSSSGDRKNYYVTFHDGLMNFLADSSSLIKQNLSFEEVKETIQSKTGAVAKIF